MVLGNHRSTKATNMAQIKIQPRHSRSKMGSENARGAQNCPRNLKMRRKHDERCPRTKAHVWSLETIAARDDQYDTKSISNHAIQDPNWVPGRTRCSELSPNPKNATKRPQTDRHHENRPSTTTLVPGQGLSNDFPVTAGPP